MSCKEVPATIVDSRADTPALDPAALGRLGRYQLVTRLAVGGMAEVYLARHGELSGYKTLVVIKKVLPHLCEHPEFTSMFLDEARIALLLDHPNVVRMFEVGRSEQEYFLAMELVQGKPLASLVRRASDRRETLDPKMAALIIAHAAHGLHHAHGLCDLEGRPVGLVHRDISPQNIVISFEGAVKVIDFGIARALGRLTETTAGGKKGKTGYMAPEQAMGDAVDHRADIFSLGVVLWEALCGRRLFGRASDLDTMRAMADEPVPRPSSLLRVPPALESVVMKALARDPARRFSSAHEMASALEKFVFQAGGGSAADLAILMKTHFAQDQVEWRNLVRMALEMESVEAMALPEVHLSVTGVPLPTAPRASSRGPRLATWLAIALAALAAMGLGTVLFRRDAPPPAGQPAPQIQRAPSGPSFEPLPARPRTP